MFRLFYVNVFLPIKTISIERLQGRNNYITFLKNVIYFYVDFI